MMPNVNAEFLKRSIEYLLKFSWIFKESNTTFVEKGVLDHIPQSWVDAIAQLSNEDFAELPNKLIIPENWPVDLKEILGSANKLKQSISGRKVDRDSSQERIKGMSPKKSHEIIRLTQVIFSQCGSVDVLVDVGCGLVSQLDIF